MDLTTISNNITNSTDESNYIIESGYSAWYYIYMVGEVIIAFMAALGNGFLVWVIFNRPNLHTTTNVLTASLAAADCLVGLIGIPCGLIGYNGYPRNAYGCLMVNSMIVILTQISIFGLLVIAVERFIAIKFPFKYQQHFTATVALIIIVIYWLLAIIVGMVPVFGWNLLETYVPVYCAFMQIIDMEYMVYFNFFACVLFPLLLMFFIYCYIFAVVRKQSKQIASLQVTIGSSSSPSAISSVSLQKQTFKKELKAAKWFAIVIGFFAFCWLPIHLCNTFYIYGKPAPLDLINFCVLLSHMNSAVNPIMYGYSNSKIKGAIKQTLGIQLSAAENDSMLGYSHAGNPPPPRMSNSKHSTQYITTTTSSKGPQVSTIHKDSSISASIQNDPHDPDTHCSKQDGSRVVRFYDNHAMEPESG